MNQISKEYAGALYALALEQGKDCPRQWAEELKTALAVLEDNPAYLALLSSPEVDGEERAQLTIADLTDKFRQLSGRTLDNDRMLLGVK